MRKCPVRNIPSIAIAACLALAGCNPDNKLQSRWGDEPVVLSDEQGRKYVVQHNIRGTYTVTRIEGVK